MMAQKTQDMYHTSSFPSILDSYLYSEGMGKAGSVAKVTQMQKPRERGVRRSVSDARLPKKKAVLEQRHLAAFRQLYRLKDNLSHRYTELLTEKVQRQRREMKQHKSAPLKTAGKHNGQSSRGLTFKELIGSTPKDNTAFLKSLPKTRYYLILELKRQLAQHDCFKGSEELEVFRSWANQSNTTQLEKQLQKMVLSSKSVPELKLEDLLKRKVEVLPKIQVSCEESDDQQEHNEVPGESGGGEQVSAPPHQGKQIQEQGESELRIPSVFLQELQVPKFSTLQPSFLESLKTNLVPMPLHKSKAASLSQRQLRLMHRLSWFNMAQSRSLLIKNGLMLKYNEGSTMQDMMEHVCPNQFLTEELDDGDSPFPAQSPKDHTEPEAESECFNQELNAQADHVPSSELSGEGQKSSTRSSRSSKVPLTMEDVHYRTILLGKTFGKQMWNNYT